MIEGTAELSHGRLEFPEEDEEVSNVLRMTAASERSDTLMIEFPGAPEDRIVFPGDPASLNLFDVYQRCESDRCEVSIPFRVLRSETTADTVTVSGDALLTRKAIIRNDTVSNEATLRFIIRE